LARCLKRAFLRARWCVQQTRDAGHVHGRRSDARRRQQAPADATKAEHAKAKGEGYRRRKPSYTREQLEAAQNMLGQSGNIADIAKNTGLSRQTIYRIKDDPASAEKALAMWGE
jgi:DNA invertase Pin-like site-specific DNA recombinase